MKTLRAMALCSMAAVALVPPAQCQEIKIAFDHGFDFSRVHRYQWRVHPIFEKHPELQDRYSTSIQLVMNDTNEQLMARGYQPVQSRPDVLLTFFVTAQDVRQTYTDMVDSYGSWYGWYSWYVPTFWMVTRTEQYLEGTLVMDLIDSATKKLIWRGSASSEITDFRNRDRNIEAEVKGLFKKFPPKERK